MLVPAATKRDSRPQSSTTRSAAERPRSHLCVVPSTPGRQLSSAWTASTPPPLVHCAHRPLQVAAARPRPAAGGARISTSGARAERAVPKFGALRQRAGLEALRRPALDAQPQLFTQSVAEMQLLHRTTRTSVSLTTFHTTSVPHKYQTSKKPELHDALAAGVGFGWGICTQSHTHTHTLRLPKAEHHRATDLTT